MNTIIMDMTDGINAKDMEKVGEVLKNGGLAAFPTETVYGLGANALDEEAARKIYAAKGRPSDNPLIVHIAQMEDLYKIAEKVPEEAEKLAKAFWPGPLTMIFRKKDVVPYGTTGGLDTVAVRMPNHEIALELIRAGGGYIAAPSANASGRPSPTTAEHVREDMDGRIDVIVDGGAVGIGVESTIVDLSEDVPMILRPGFINQEMLEKVIGKVEMDPAVSGADVKGTPKAPGMKYRHYAPRAQMVIVEGDRDKVIDYINGKIKEEKAKGNLAGVIASDETIGCYDGGIVKSMGTRTEELSISRHLFGVLREFDSCNVSIIFSESFYTPDLGAAIMNRLMKAAGHQIIRI